LFSAFPPFRFRSAFEGFSLPKTRVRVRLLGPCSKTGRTNPFRQRRREARTRENGPEPPTTPARFRDERRLGLARPFPPPADPPEPPRRLPGPRTFDRPRPCKPPPTPRTTPTKNLDPDPMRSAPTPRWHATGRKAPTADCRAETSRPLRFGTSRREKPTADGRSSRSRSMASYGSPLTISSSFDLLFRVLFTFPSQYFCAIGLVACI